MRRLSRCRCSPSPQGAIRQHEHLAPAHTFDFIEIGVAYLQPSAVGLGTCNMREPLALELAAHLGHEIDKRPLTAEAWVVLALLAPPGTRTTVREGCRAQRQRACMLSHSPAWLPWVLQGTPWKPWLPSSALSTDL